MSSWAPWAGTLDPLVRNSNNSQNIVEELMHRLRDHKIALLQTYSWGPGRCMKNSGSS